MSTRLEIPDWTGSTLTAGAFSEYVGRVIDAFKAQGFAPLALTEIGPQLEAAHTRFTEFVNRERAYDETLAIAKADANRDALWKAFYHAWNYIMQLDPTHPLYAEAVKLRSEMTPYKGVWTHELEKETAELSGLQRDLEKSYAALLAVQALGLNTIVTALFAANDTVRELLKARDVERGNRVADKGGDTTASLRKAVTGFLVDAYRQVNAVARINPGGSAELAIREVNGYIAHYKDIAAQPSKRSGKDEPTPEPDEEVPAS